MEYLKVISLNDDTIHFDNGAMLYSEHVQDCCENHYLSFSDLTSDDFEDVRFDLSNDMFFKRIDGYGIELIPILGHPIRIPGYADNNGYYSSNLSLVLCDRKFKVIKEWDISDCQSY
jgi:hypothetical protein